jgi:hypothetical protein
MNRATRQRILLDRRLVERPGWIDAAALERELAKLPDVSHKVAPTEEAATPAEGNSAQ